MSLAPFEVIETTSDACSKELVAVTVEWIALVRFRPEEDALKASASRSLSANREEILRAIKEIMNVQVRAICATMSVEELNANRERLVSSVTREVDNNLTELGMEMDSFQIQRISDP
jgi:flotillin